MMAATDSGARGIFINVLGKPMIVGDCSTFAIESGITEVF